MVTEVKLTRGLVALIDDEDAAEICKHKWYASPEGYAERNAYVSVGCTRTTGMHRDILKLKYGDGLYADHINADRLDNRRSNLRICTNAENLLNRGVQPNNELGIKGISWRPDVKKFRARTTFKGKDIHLGFFNTLEEAKAAYQAALFEFHGEFANTGR